MKKFILGFVITGLALIVFSTCVRTFAQTLPRKGGFGAGAQPVDETTAKTNNLKTGEGLIVVSIAPNGTFEQLGIKVGDIILSINQKAINTTAEYVASVQTFVEGNPIEVNIISNGQKVAKKGIVKGKLKETSDNAEVNYDEVKMSLGTLRTITHIPKNRQGKVPVVFYIQGLPCQSNELPDAKDPRRQAFEDWVKAGFAVFRVERPNLGDSVATKECRDIDFKEELEVNTAGYKKLLSYDFIDTDNVFFFGHSMAGWTAPYIAEVKQPKGIIVYGVGLISWFEYLIHVYRTQSTYGGASHVAAEQQTRQMIPMLYEWLEEGKTAEEMRKNPALKPMVDQTFDGEYFQTRSANFFYTMNKQNLAEAWSKVSSKVLAMYGEFDIQALNGRDAELIAETVNQSHPGNGEYLLLPKTEHVFSKSESYRQVAELYSKPNFYQYLKDNYNPEVGRVTNEWMKKVMKK